MIKAYHNCTLETAELMRHSQAVETSSELHLYLKSHQSERKNT